MDSCSLEAILFPSMFAIKNKIIGIPCHEDPSCIGYTIVASLGVAYVIYRILTTGRRLFHENETTLEIEKAIAKKFAPKKGDLTSSYMHRDMDEEEPYDVDRAVDEDGVSLLQEKTKLSLYDVEYKLDGMKVVPVDKNTGKVLDEKQVETLRKQLLKNWRFEDEDEDDE